MSHWICGIAIDTQGAKVPASGLENAFRATPGRATEPNVNTLISSNLKGHDRLHMSALSALEIK